ncbi:Fc.00g075220.m01.CDS01 [Cosmosporella sp. VM-42]
MSEWSGFMYASAAPLPTFYYRRSKREKERQSKVHQRSNSVNTSSRRPFRHSRTSSGSQASRSSHESSSLHSNSNSPAALPAVSAAVGDDGQHHQPTVVSSDSRVSTSTVTSPRPLLSIGANSSGSSIFSSRTGSERSWARDRRLRHHEAPSSVDLKNVAMYSDFEASSKPASGTTKQISIPFARTESVSSTSGTTTLSTRTMTSTDPSNSSDNPATKPFVLRNGRTYFNDPTLQYPLPSDLTELHRQCLRTMLLIQVYDAPFITPSLMVNPPLKVLEIGCGSGFWSMMCHRYYKERGHTGISFTGIDIAPLAPGSTNTPADAVKTDKDMNWRFIQHDLRQLPWPLATEEYDLVMVKDVTMIIPNMLYEAFIDEYIRLLRPGGVLEMWDSDATVRMLRPHVPSPSPGTDEAEDHERASRMGAYVMTSNTPLSAPLNTFLVEYNHWLSRALEARTLTAVPCTLIGPFLIQESETMTEVRSKRLAIPLSEVRWEREGVGGVVTKDGKSYVEMKGKGAPHQKVEKKTLTSGQSALRKTALLTVVQQIQALEPILREASGKSQDEWDVWLGKMMADLMSESGTSWGECLEVGAWSARKRQT